MVRAMHEIAARTAAAFLTAEHLEAMRAANHRFEAATRAGDIDAAMRADDELHGVLVRVGGNRAVAATIERYTPLIRRLERRQFSKARARHSVERHNQLMAYPPTCDQPRMERELAQRGVHPRIASAPPATKGSCPWFGPGSATRSCRG
jgi:DNA-binding GntR family transcriptional regulator